MPQNIISMRNRYSTMLIATVALVFGLTSCTKKYTCQCVISYSGSPGLPDTTVNEYDVYNSKKGAEKVCEEASYEKTENGVKIVETCKLF